MLRVAEVAQAAAPKGNVINMLQVPGAADVAAGDAPGALRRGQPAALTESARPSSPARRVQGLGGPHDDAAVSGARLRRRTSLVFSDFLNLFLFNTKHNVGALLKALKQTGYFQSLAEPNLIAYNGQEASFLAGGEFPVPIVQGDTGAVTVEFKEFGVRLTFKPMIAGDLIRLHVRPEVSSLDFNNGILLEGFRIPALTTRRAETEVELRDGQSFAIAGLIDNKSQNDVAAIPFLSQMPIIGNLFKSKAERKERTELLGAGDAPAGSAAESRTTCRRCPPCRAVSCLPATTSASS